MELARRVVVLAPRASWSSINTTGMAGVPVEFVDQAGNRVAQFWARDQMVHQMQLPDGAVVLAAYMACGFHDRGCQTQLWVPNNPCRGLGHLHVHVAPEQCFGSVGGRGLLSKLQRRPLLWERVCLHVDASGVVPRIECDQCVIEGEGECLEFVQGQEILV